MAEGNGPVASAVIIPESIADTSNPPKRRRQSPLASSPSSSKRLRLSEQADGQNSKPSPTASEPTAQSPDLPNEIPVQSNAKPDRHKISALEERKRGQRLFGGLLNTLSQSAPSGQQKRRQDIEKKQAERAKLQKHDDEVRMKENADVLHSKRKREQVKFDERSMHLRHQNELAMAHSLRTDSEPRIYFKPWDLLPSQAARIKAQISATEIVIKREVDEWYEDHPESAPRKSDEQSKKSSEECQTKANKETQGELPQTKSNKPSLPPSPSASNPQASIETANTNDTLKQVEEAMPSSKAQRSTESHGEHEHNGEVVLEAEEDTVIY